MRRLVPLRAVCGILWHVVCWSAGELRHLHARLPSPKKKAVPTWLQFLLFLGSQKILYSHSNCNVPRVPLLRLTAGLPACLTHALSSGADQSLLCRVQHATCWLQFISAAIIVFLQI